MSPRRAQSPRKFKAAKRRVELCGPLRDCGLGDYVDLEIPEGANAACVLEILRARFSSGQVLQGSVLATQSEILEPSSLVPSYGALAVLPPVCGG